LLPDRRRLSHAAPATGWIGGTILFVVAALTDYVDGWIARRHNMTPFGKMSTRIADKAMVIIAISVLFAPLA
jgi:CDP-diacylglycerol--glycerol-3-phosphate 3-phosphatidyltransferase